MSPITIIWWNLLDQKMSAPAAGVFRFVRAAIIVALVAVIVWAVAILTVRLFPYTFLGFSNDPEQRAWAGEAVNLSGVLVSIRRSYLHGMDSALTASGCDERSATVQKLLDEQARAMRGTARANGLATRIEYFYEQVRSVERDMNTPDSFKESTKGELREQQVHLVYHLDNVLNEMGVGLANPAFGSPHNAEIDGLRTTKWAKRAS